jgi:hypothetical protein
MITPRDLSVLSALVRYYVLNRGQIQRLCFSDDRHGRITRRRLQALVDGHYISRQAMLFCHPSEAPAAPVYFPAQRGVELLAAHFEDERYLATPTQSPIPHHVQHWLAVSDLHITLDMAVETDPEAKIAEWVNEYDVVNKDESQPERRFRLYTLLRDSPRLVCAPDAAMLLTCRGHAKTFYFELDRATTGAHQVAGSKTQGYAVFAELGFARRHYPQATVEGFTILCVAPNARRRDALRNAISDKPGAKLWRFASVEELSPETVLRKPIWYPCTGEKAALIKGES